MTNIRVVFLFLLALVSLRMRAQGPQSQTSAEIYRNLQKLNVLGTVLYVAAHPDDENTRLLAYLAREAQFTTGYLSLTRGDGGQNLIGDEQGVELGLIRTQELLAARRIDGAEQFFSRAYDFGFSKSSEEALRIWDHDAVLSDVVWTIRRYQPDVIITRFPGDARAGHGHHAASAILANEAFVAAADPNRFPEHFKDGLQPWKARRILWNTFNFGGNNTITDDQFHIEVGDFNRLLGKGYGEIASDSRSQHKSQGFGVAKTRGRSMEYFLTTGGDAPHNRLMDGIVTGWNRVDGGNAIQPLVDRLLKDFNFEHPENSLDQLTGLYKKIQALPENSVYKTRKLKEVAELIAQCAGLFAEASTDAAYAIKGQPFRVNYFINSRSSNDIKLEAVSLGNVFDSTIGKQLPMNVNWEMAYTGRISLEAPVSQPYWLQRPMEMGSFRLEKQSDIAVPENRPAFTAGFRINVKGLELLVERPVMYRFTDPVKGEIYEPVTVAPPLVISLTPSMVLTNITPALAQEPVVDLQYKSYFNYPRVPVKVQLFQGNVVIYSRDTLMDLEKEKAYNVRMPLSAIVKKDAKADVRAVVTLTLDGKAYAYKDFLRSINYDHIPGINYFLEDHLSVIATPVNTGGKKRVGYIVGAGDKVPQALTQMGYDVTILHEADITPVNLSRFDAVIAGVRAYNIHEFLETKYPVLMQYVQNGGNYIVQYNTHAKLKARMAPYPLAIINKRITDERAAVEILMPSHAVFNTPNKITAADFDGWIQERSIYQAETTDSHYQLLLGMSDKGEAQSKGSLVITPYGKGNFVYTGLVFFRELPAGVPGAFRLMANLVALPQNKSN
ncbi:PIG-L family deacetylase [Filimonas effusa]|uniref:PIG-L family deacetylase n=2 Tax=Filimonas effusa TaxID=2508721 RepID=A0A4Q1D792_9BACT|nr:PIG-L family deacetylase [Filimonas effusa]